MPLDKDNYLCYYSTFEVFLLSVFHGDFPLGTLSLLLVWVRRRLNIGCIYISNFELAQFLAPVTISLVPVKEVTDDAAYE